MTSNRLLSSLVWPQMKHCDVPSCVRSCYRALQLIMAPLKEVDEKCTNNPIQLMNSSFPGLPSLWWGTQHGYIIHVSYVEAWTLKQVFQLKLLTHMLNVVWQDSFNRAKKWVQELQRQGTALDFTSFVQYCGQNWYSHIEQYINLVSVLSMVGIGMQAIQILWWLLRQTRQIWTPKERSRLRYDSYFLGTHQQFAHILFYRISRIAVGMSSFMGSKFRESSCGKPHMLKSHVHHWSKLDSSCSSYMSVDGNLVVLL
jgi:hypothetical protein